MPRKKVSFSIGNFELFAYSFFKIIEISSGQGIYVFELFVVFFSLSYELFFPLNLQNSKDESRRFQGGMPSCQKGKKKLKCIKKLRGVPQCQRVIVRETTRFSRWHWLRAFGFFDYNSKRMIRLTFLEKS